MKYHEIVKLKDGRDCVLRSASSADAAAVLGCFLLTHRETDFLLTYPLEMTMTEEQEGEYLRTKEESAGAVELLALVDGKTVGTFKLAPIAGTTPGLLFGDGSGRIEGAVDLAYVEFKRLK